MKRAWSFVVVVLASLSLAGADEPAKATLKLEGMTCGGCVAAVKFQLKRTEGVTTYDVSLEKGEAEVSFDPAKTTPEKIAESVSKTGFNASVKGKKDEGTSAKQGAAPLDLRALKDWFNGASDSVRVVSILSPTCPVCQSGHGVLKGVFGKTDSKDLRGFIVWLPMKVADDPASAAVQAASFRDTRIVEAWDAQRAAGVLFARMLKLKGTAWDVYLLYGRGVRWEGQEPPVPSFWMHQLEKEDGADQKLCLDPSRLTRQALALLERKG